MVRSDVTNDASMGGMQDIGRAVQQLGIGEKMAVLGAAGVLAVWLVFDLLMTEYSIGHLPFALAALVVFFAYRFHMQHATHWPVDYGTLVVVLAGLIGLLGLLELVTDLRYEIFDTDGSTIVGAIAYWAAAIVAGVGAFRMSN